MKYLAFVILMVSTALSAAPTLKEVVNKQAALVGAGRLFEVQIQYYPGNPEETLKHVVSLFSFGGDRVSYFRVDPALHVAKMPYLPANRQPESPDLHPPIVDWYLNLPEITAAIESTGHPFTNPARMEITTIGRLRGRSIVYSPALWSHYDAESVIVVMDQVRPGQTGEYVIIDGAEGKVINRGTFKQPGSPPPIPGNVSSGG